jgi:hypothetical protein
MEHINNIAKLGEIDYPPLAQNVDSDLFDSRADSLYGFSIAWFESVLESTEFESCGTVGFIGEVSKIVET